MTHRRLTFFMRFILIWSTSFLFKCRLNISIYFSKSDFWWQWHQCLCLTFLSCGSATVSFIKKHLNSWYFYVLFKLDEALRCKMISVEREKSKWKTRKNSSTRVKWMFCIAHRTRLTYSTTTGHKKIEIQKIKSIKKRKGKAMDRRENGWTFYHAIYNQRKRSCLRLLR